MNLQSHGFFKLGAPIQGCLYLCLVCPFIFFLSISFFMFSFPDHIFLDLATCCAAHVLLAKTVPPLHWFVCCFLDINWNKLLLTEWLKCLSQVCTSLCRTDEMLISGSVDYFYEQVGFSLILAAVQRNTWVHLHRTVTRHAILLSSLLFCVWPLFLKQLNPLYIFLGKNGQLAADLIHIRA